MEGSQSGAVPPNRLKHIPMTRSVPCVFVSYVHSSRLSYQLVRSDNIPISCCPRKTESSSETQVTALWNLIWLVVGSVKLVTFVFMNLTKASRVTRSAVIGIPTFSSRDLPILIASPFLRSEE